MFTRLRARVRPYIGAARRAIARARIRLGQSRVRLQAVPTSVVLPARETARFDGPRAFAWLEAQCARGSRAPGTAGHEATRRLIVEYLAEHADAVATQTWRQRVFRGPGAGKSFALTNVFARFDGRDAVEARGAGHPPDLMLSTHWDTRPVADRDPDPARRRMPVPGASDGASGVAVLLELARVLAGSRPARTTVLAFWDGEDFGEYFHGSRLFARVAHRPAYAGWRAARGVLIDMIGGRALRCVTELNSIQVAPALWAEVHACASARGLADHFHGPAGAVRDDHVFLSEAGIPTVLLIDSAYPYHHTTNDVPGECSAESLAVIGAVLERLAVDGQA